LRENEEAEAMNIEAKVPAEKCRETHYSDYAADHPDYSRKAAAF
jgi:hypothetical protein